MVHAQLERLKRRLNKCETKRADAESKLEESEGKLADAEAKLEESQRVIAALQASNAPDMSRQAREAFEEEITILRQRGGEIQETLESLEEENQERKQHERKAKHSLLRSFRWKERDVDPVVLDGAVAFWGATADKDCTGTSTRTSKAMRKKIMKAIIKYGFRGELQKELEQEIVKKKRFKVYDLAKLSDLESKFNSEALGSIAHCETGLKKNQQGLLPSATTFNNCLMDLNRKATSKGFSCMPDSNTWCWGDAEGNTLKEGVHRYVKAVYFDAWDERATADDPYVLVVTGDLARVSFSGKAVTLCGAKQCDRRLVSQQMTGKANMNQSRTLYTPAMGGYTKESDMMPLFEQLVDYFVEIENQGFCVVDGKEYEVFVKVLVVADMMFLHKFTRHGGCCATTTHFCMFCSCMSKFRHEGQPGGCEDCRNIRKVYDANGLQICLHHDVITPDILVAQRARLVHLQNKLRGNYPPRKKPVWEDLHGLRLACLQRCFDGITNKDGRNAYDPRDKIKIPTMNTKECEAWLNERTEGSYVDHVDIKQYEQLHLSFHFASLHFLEGCTLSNNPVVGVHNIPKERLLTELDIRHIPIPRRDTASISANASTPPLERSAVGASVAKFIRLQGKGQVLMRGSVYGYKPSANGGRYTIHYADGHIEALDSSAYQNSYNLATDDEQREVAYVAHLRQILVGRLKEEEELERLEMYSRDERFDIDVDRPMWELHRIVIDMLHCLMRMHEKVLFLLYFAAMNRCQADPRAQAELLDRMSAQTRIIGNLPETWSHTLDNDKQGNAKLLPFKFNYDKSKKIFSYNALPGLYELIDIAIVSETDNLNWRAFLVSYLNCMELLTLSRDYTAEEVEELDVRCKKMYHLLVTKIGGLEAVTNYFHYLGSGHVVWMVRRYGNLWRFRNEGVEAFNKVVSLRHNKHNKNGGYNKTRKGELKRKCAEFWSLGQWLGRWSMWHLGYADAMKHDCDKLVLAATADDATKSDGDSDDNYNIAEDSDSGSDSDSVSDCSDSGSDCSASCAAANAGNTGGADNVEESHWNGLWFANSSDDDMRDSNDEYSQSEDDTDDDNSSNSEDVDATPSDLSLRACRAQSLYGRACNSLSLRIHSQHNPNAVHAAS